MNRRAEGDAIEIKIALEVGHDWPDQVRDVIVESKSRHFVAAAGSVRGQRCDDGKLKISTLAKRYHRWRSVRHIMGLRIGFSGDDADKLFVCGLNLGQCFRLGVPRRSGRCGDGMRIAWRSNVCSSGGECGFRRGTGLSFVEPLSGIRGRVVAQIKEKRLAIVEKLPFQNCRLTGALVP